MEKKGIAIGVDNFLKIRENKAYYVDKSLLIKKVVDSQSEVLVFTRPRRFGKSLNISMLTYYFDKQHSESAWAFDHLAIKEAGEPYKSLQNAYPVVKLVLKSVVSTNFNDALIKFKYVISSEYTRHQYLLESDRLSSKEKAYIERMILEKGTQADCEVSLRKLSEYLYRHHQQKVIVLIDEYDVPLEKAYFARNSYYNEMIDFMREFYEALKTNDALYKTIITGCLRVAKESIFTGLNNLEIISILSDEASEFFGFTELEVNEMLDYYDLPEKKEEAKSWYNGYEFGNATVYNPWSILNYVKDMRGNFPFPRAHWSNTSSNSIIKTLIRQAKPEVKAEIEQMLQGKPLKKVIREEVVYGEIEKNMDNLWSFLFLTGYLKKVSQEQIGEKISLELALPNRELKYIYDTQISDWFEEIVLQETNFDELYGAVRAGDALGIQQQLMTHISECISYLDHYENFYHGFVTGILKGIPGCVVLSNRESGNGRSDIFVKEKVPSERALIFEIKMADSFPDLAETAQKALKQIDEKNYEADLLYHGYTEIEKYGVAFFKKRCKVIKG